MDKKLSVASMFSGIGGIDLGFLQAGYEIVWANERDKAACKTYRYNFKNSNLVEKDILSVHAKDLPDFDVLVAGFPCQPFSIAGKQRGFQDARGNMFFEIARIAKEKMPRVIFLENVANLQEHDEGKTFLVIFNILASLGYSVRYRIMPSHEYGNTPQTRDRIYIIAFLDDIECDMFSFPEKEERTVKINDIINRAEKQHNIYYYDGKQKELFEKVVRDVHFIYRVSDYGIYKVRNNMCPTLTANMGTYLNRVPLVRDDFGIRKLTLRECLDFQGFPKHFKFPNSITIQDAYKQIGNSVVVPVVKKLADSIKKVIT